MLRLVCNGFAPCRAGVDWKMVASYVDIGDSLDKFVGPLEGYKTAGEMQRQASNMSLASVSASVSAAATGYDSPGFGSRVWNCYRIIVFFIPCRQSLRLDAWPFLVHK